jgi:hypothetical protein
MALKKSKLAAATTLAAAISMLAAVPAEAQSIFGGWGYGGYGGYGYRHRNRVDVGDVIGAVVVLGTIAAIAGAVNRGARARYDDRYRGRYPGNDENRYRTPGAYERGTSTGIDRAVDMCLGEVERNQRVASVDNAARDRDGWIISGRLAGGSGFSCRIGNDGRISDVNLGNYGYGSGTAPAERVEDRQYEDDVYARARINLDRVPPLPADEAQDEPEYDQGG